MVDIIHRVGMKAPLSKVYAALSTVEGIADWWTKETSGSSKIGGMIGVRFQQEAVTNPPVLLVIGLVECPEVGLRQDS